VAISTNGGGNSRSRRRASPGMLSEINVTPFVDVMLVLLIIFMLTAHVMEFGIQVDVPKTRAVADSAKELPVVNITKDGTLYLNEKETDINRTAGRDPAAFQRRHRRLPARRQRDGLGAYRPGHERAWRGQVAGERGDPAGRCRR
jgi:hypothetical protein